MFRALQPDADGTVFQRRLGHGGNDIWMTHRRAFRGLHGHNQPMAEVLPIDPKAARQRHQEALVDSDRLSGLSQRRSR